MSRSPSGGRAPVMKWVFKWLFRLFLLAIVLLAIFLLSLDSILRLVAEHNIRAQTGMEAEIGRFHLGLLEPVVEIQDLKLYNPPAFDGTPFLNIREVHVEYDREALARRQVHVTLMRFNLGELDIVRNEAGLTNIFALGPAPDLSVLSSGGKLPSGESKDLKEFERQTGLKFQGIDVLNVSVGTAKYIDLKDQRNNRAQNIDIENFPIRNVRTGADLAGLGLLVAVRSGDFFSSLVLPPGSKN